MNSNNASDYQSPWLNLLLIKLQGKSHQKPCGSLLTILLSGVIKLQGKSHQKPCGSLLTILGELSGVDKSTTSRLITKTIRAIAGLHSEFIEMPSNAEDVQTLRESFYNISKFPRCIGALDCTHLRIQSPGGQDAERYRNRKGFFSHNVRVVCDSDLLIRNIVCRRQGSARDSTIFNNSSLKVKLENEEFGEGSLVVGDSGYAVRKYLITPLANPRTPAEHLFNESQIRTRNPVERCFGAWKRRFLALALGIRLHNSKVEAIATVAAAVLHNVACMMNDAEPRVTNDEEAAVQLTININNDHVEMLKQNQGLQMMKRRLCS
ncbi:DDE superfamily endonuclease [Popillia japonica]|uniref:DDE superfamily endonuclease n=1 Tax=Popillia japonica TaxID=7064 RepID=A0AAW1HF24_POPJA